MRVDSVAFHPDGRTLLASDGHPSVGTWDLATGRFRGDVPAWTGGLGRRVWVDGSDPGQGSVRFRDVSSGRVLGSIEGRFDSYSLSRDERTLVAIRWQRVALVEVHGGRIRDLTEFAASTDSVPSAVALSPDGTLVAVGSPRCEIVLLDRRPHFRDATMRPSADEWRALREEIGRADYDDRVRGGLIRQYPSETIAELGRWRELDEPPTRERLALLLARLDDDNFRVREAATRELRAKTPTVVRELHRFLEAKPSAEAEGRVRRLLEAVASTPAIDARLRDLRAVGVLETIGTPEAKAVLREYAALPDGAIATSAKDALVRLGE